MVLFLAFLVAYWVKTEMLVESKSFTYFHAFALPLIVLKLLAANIIYQRYIIKLRDSHPTISVLMTVSLVLAVISFGAFAFLFSQYLDTDNVSYAYYAIGPYLFVILLAIAYYVYLVPGMTVDGPTTKTSRAEEKQLLTFTQVILLGSYLTIALLMPLFLYFFVSSASTHEERNLKFLTMPLIVLFSIHLLFLLPALCFFFEKSIEFLLIALLLSIALVGNSSAYVTLGLVVAAWITLYAYLFLI
jgi:hypothetical protein